MTSSLTGKYSNIKLFYGPMNFPYGTNQTDVWVINADQDTKNAHALDTGGWRTPLNLVDPIPGGHDKPPWYTSTAFGMMYAVSFICNLTSY